MESQAELSQPRWPRLLIGAVLLWRALSAVAFANSADFLDPRYLAERSSPGLNRSIKLAFANYRGNAHSSRARLLSLALLEHSSEPNVWKRRR